MPGLSLRLGLGYAEDRESMTMAINLAMRTLIIERLALEFGLDLTYPEVSQGPTQQVGGTLSVIVFMSGSRISPYIVGGTSLASELGAAVDSLLISILGGVGFEFRINDALSVGLDCRGYVAMSSSEPGSALRGVICAAALSFSPLALLR